jgi:hypothetical protein
MGTENKHSKFGTHHHKNIHLNEIYVMDISEVSCMANDLLYVALDWQCSGCVR